MIDIWFYFFSWFCFFQFWIPVFTVHRNCGWQVIYKCFSQICWSVKIVNNSYFELWKRRNGKQNSRASQRVCSKRGICWQPLLTLVTLMALWQQNHFFWLDLSYDPFHQITLLSKLQTGWNCMLTLVYVFVILSENLLTLFLVWIQTNIHTCVIQIFNLLMHISSVQIIRFAISLLLYTFSM